MTCFILFSLEYAKNRGHTRSSWRYDKFGYEYISKLDHEHDWFDDTVSDNFNSREWDRIRRLFH